MSVRASGTSPVQVWRTSMPTEGRAHMDDYSPVLMGHRLGMELRELDWKTIIFAKEPTALVLKP